MKLLPLKIHRAWRWPLICFLALSIGAGFVLYVTAQEKQEDGLFAQVKMGQTYPATLKIRNTCRKPHLFRINNQAAYLRFTDQVESILVAPGTRRPIAGVFETTGLETRVYQDKLIVECLDCRKEKGCTQDKNEIPVRLTVAGPAIIPAVAAADTRPAKLNCCQCLGGSNTLDLSTKSANNWLVDGNSVVFPTNIDRGWSANTGAAAEWVSINMESWDNVYSGKTYIYSLQFEVPACLIDQQVKLSGFYGGDNNVSVYLDAKLLSSCTNNECFKSGSVRPPFNNVEVVPGLHTLIVKVENERYSLTGMFINARIIGVCAGQTNSTGQGGNSDTKRF